MSNEYTLEDELILAIRTLALKAERELADDAAGLFGQVLDQLGASSAVAVADWLARYRDARQ